MLPRIELNRAIHNLLILFITGDGEETLLSIHDVTQHEAMLVVYYCR